MLQMLEGNDNKSSLLQHFVMLLLWKFYKYNLSTLQFFFCYKQIKVLSVKLYPKYFFHSQIIQKSTFFVGLKTCFGGDFLAKDGVPARITPPHTDFQQELRKDGAIWKLRTARGTPRYI